MFDSPVLLAFVFLTFFFAGLIKGVIGVGLPTVVMGLLSVTMPTAEAAALLVIPSIATNVWQMAAGPDLRAQVKRLAPMIVTIFVGTFATIGLLTSASTGLAQAALGAVLAAYGIYGLAGPRFVVGPGAERWLTPTIGLVTGAVTGSTGVFVVPTVPYLSALKFERDALIQSLGLAAFVCPVALGLALAFHGRYHATLAGASAAALVPAIVGMFLGQRVRGRLQPAAFRRWFFTGLVALGGYMALRAFR